MEPESTKNVEAIERFKQLEEQHFKEPVNGQFEDCTKESKCYLQWRRKAVVMKRTRTLPQFKLIVINVIIRIMCVT